MALILGPLIAFALNGWFNVVAKPETIDRYLWLAWLQEPGAQTGEFIARLLYPVVGSSWGIRIGVICGYAVLVSIWIVAIWIGMTLCRTTIALFQERVRAKRPVN